MPKAKTSPTDLKTQAGQLLRARREELGLSLRLMGRRLDIADTSLMAMELGRDNPTLDRLERIAKGYGLVLSLVADDTDPVEAAGG